jgi:glycosyltransferase involved in cell wall biosynthesis
LILSYNHENYIERSILSAIEQESNEIKINVFVIDDGSEDNTIKILKKLISIYPDKLFVNFKKHTGVEGIPANFNELIMSSDGEFLAFLASDDEYKEGRFKKQLEIMSNDESVSIVYSNGSDRDKNGKYNNVTFGESRAALISKDPKLCLRHVLSVTPVIYLQSVLMRASFAKSNKFFDEDLIADDWIFNIRVFQELIYRGLKFDYIDDITFIRNIHIGNTSSNVLVQFKRVEQVINKYFYKSDRRKNLAVLLLGPAKYCFQEKKYLLGINYLFRYIWNDPFLNVIIKKIIK